MSLREITLADKYERSQGSVYITGMQAIARIVIAQKRADAGAGLNTAGFVTGYRGSPLGTLDTAMLGARRELEAHDVLFRPGVNEELAATAVYGSQQTAYFDRPRRDGVFAAWYGKGPGVDRAGDALKHGNLAGTARRGGVLAFAGDDHPGKSSTTAHQSEQALAAAMIPILYPANVEEYLRYGALGYALSRYSGLWIGFKCVNDTADSTFTARLSRVPREFVTPERELPPEGLNIIPGDSRFAQEARTVEHRLPAAQAFARLNGCDETVYGGRDARFGIVTAGKAWLDVMEALDLLGIEESRAGALGIKVLKLGMVWPADGQTIANFAEGLREVLVVEEKRPFIEQQVKDALYHLPAAARPDVSGKRTPGGAPLLAAFGELSPSAVGGALGQRLSETQVADETLSEAARKLEARVAQGPLQPLTGNARTPYYCSGCPHNTSTALPEGAVGLAGIGCHVMASMMPQRKHVWPVQMGGEGVNWTGAEPFVETDHVFQNLGDGTYHHSGVLAIRAAVAAGSHITFKLLVNDAVAMTGGQAVEGELSVGRIAAELLQEGVGKVVVVAEEPERYRGARGEERGRAKRNGRGGGGAGETSLPDEVEVYPRDEMARIQSELPAVEGVSVLIYDQVCAAEKRRRRKRGEFPDPPKRLFINEAVCEGCGDCGAKSNCVSLQPAETELGRKRRIDQSSCNKDYSCLKGFCPSFVTVHGGRLRKTLSGDGNIPFPALPEPERVDLHEPCSVIVTGVGGTGVVTVGAVLGMAAHLERSAVSVMDMTGLSQKNGAVYSHVRFARRPDDIRAAKIGLQRADLVLGCDMVAAATGEAIAAVDEGRTAMVVNGSVSTTAAFTYTPDLQMDVAGLAESLRGVAGRERFTLLEASELARRVLGDAIGANTILLGAALQLGLLPVGREALERAIELNGVAVEMNLTALALGRWAAIDPEAVAALAGTEERRDPDPARQSLSELVDTRAALLEDYQDTRYAQRYRDLVDRARAAETDAGLADCSFAAAVARYGYKLMAYKDEYEVARLFSNGEFRRRLEAEFEGDYRLTFHLAPPLIAPKDSHSGEPKKLTFGPWMMRAFRLLAALRRLRGTPFDPFGRTAERRTERRLIADYTKMIDTLCAKLDRDTRDTVVALASFPEDVRGFGHVKARHLEKALARRDALLRELDAAPERREAATAA